MKTNEYQVLDSLVDYYLQILVKRVVNKIKSTTKAAMSSGDDSGLRSVWDELCVQVQDERFDEWDLLDDMVSLICEGEFDKLEGAIQFALTFSACEKYGEDFDNDCAYPELVSDMIKDKVYDYAMNFENRQIKYYLERRLTSDDTWY